MYISSKLTCTHYMQNVCTCKVVTCNDRKLNHLIIFIENCCIFDQILAKKMTVLYKLAKGQLSRQHHYDFGLRALKAVLVMAGELKRGSPDLNEVRGRG